MELVKSEIQTNEKKSYETRKTYDTYWVQTEEYFFGDFLESV